MNSKLLFTLWGVLYALCAILGFIPAPGTAAGIFMTLCAIFFFAPPLVLIRTGSRFHVELIRNLAVIWLALTVLLIIGNILSITDSLLVGNILHCLLVVISSPMICSRYWVLAIFGWAWLLFDAVHRLKQA